MLEKPLDRSATLYDCEPVNKNSGVKPSSILPIRIINPVSGEELDFLYDTEPDKVLEINAAFPPGMPSQLLHAHPFQDEFYFVTSGTLTVQKNNTVKSYNSGEFIHIRKNQSHAVWNAGNSPATANWRTFPALNTAEFLRFTCSRSGYAKMNNEVMPKRLKSLIVLSQFSQVYRQVSFAGILSGYLYFGIRPLIMLSRYILRR